MSGLCELPVTLESPREPFFNEGVPEIANRPLSFPKDCLLACLPLIRAAHLKRSPETEPPSPLIRGTARHRLTHGCRAPDIKRPSTLRLSTAATHYRGPGRRAPNQKA